MKKRILSIVLSIVMILSLMPTTALALASHSHCVCGGSVTVGGHTHENITSWVAWDGKDRDSETLGDQLTAGSYYLTGDVGVNSVTIVGEVNLCLNGHTITTTNNYGAFYVKSGATLNICDCSTNQSGEIKNTNASDDYPGIYNNGGTVNVYGGTVSGADTGIRNNGCTVNVYGGTVSGANPGIKNEQNSNLNIYNGTAQATGSTGYGIYNQGTVSVSGGIVTGGSNGIHNYYTGTVAVSGTANITGTTGIYNDGGTFNVSGGTVTATGNSGSGIVNSGTGTLTVSGGTVTANNGSSKGISNSGTLNLQGAPSITGAAADIYLNSNKLITIGEGGLTYTSGKAISVRMNTPGTFTSGWTTKMGNNADNYGSYFTSKNEGYTVQPDNGELKIAEPPATETHSHDMSVTCGGSGVTYTAWDGTGTPSGNVYLTGNVTLTDTLAISTGTVNLCLNGKTITNKTNKTNITVNSGATLNICDCSEPSTGKITGNGNSASRQGGGVYLNDGTVNLYGGSITGNRAQQLGAGVYVTNDGTFNMYAGNITGNYAMFGDGVYLNSGTFNMSGGTISGNSSSSQGGGVYLKSGTFNMSGTAAISGNMVSDNGGGVYVHSGTFNVSGSPVITGNTVGGTANNVYLPSGKAITVNQVLEAGASIGVKMAAPGVFTKPDGTNVTNLADYVNFFTSDDLNYKPAVDGTDLTLMSVAVPITGPIAITTTPEPTVGQEFSLGYIVIPNGNYKGMGKRFSPQLSIEAGKDYTLSVELKPNDGYYFADDVTATVNGKAATVERSGDNIFIKYTYSFASPAANSVDILLSGSSAGIAPVVLPGINEADVTMDFTAKVLDQYGQEMSDPTVEWSIDEAAGISVDANGTVTVTKDAAVGNYTLTATCDGKSDGITIQVKKAASVATSIKIFKGENEVTADTIYIPEQYRNTVNYTAVVYDQYGEVMSADDAEITKTHENTTATGFGSAEVNNRIWNVYVDASTGKAGSFDLVLTSGNASASVHITFAYLETQTITCANVTGTYGQTEELKLNPSGKQTADDYRFAIKSGASTDVVEVASDGKLTIKNAGETTIVVTAPSDATHASASVEVKVTIDKADMSAEVTAEGYNAVFDNQAHTITVTIPAGASVKYGTAEGTYNLDSAPKYTNAKTYTVYYKVEKANYNEVTGSADVVINKKDITNAEITLGEALTFNGNEQTQTIASATVDGLAITYNVSGNVNTNAGNYTLTITGNGNFEGTAQKTYAIARKSVEGANVGSFNAMTYTGSEQTPVASVTIDGLTATGTWSNVTNVADTTTFTADGNFTGTIANRNAGMSKATPVVTAPVAADGLVYNGTAQKLATAGSTTAGILKYSIDNANWIDTIPEETNAANYTVYYKVIGDENYNDVVAQSISVSIAKADSTATPPTANTLTYNTSAQTLVTAGIANGGQMQYSLDGTTWRADIPAGTNANTYTVYYKVVGDANHDDNAGGSVSVTIGKADKTAPEVAGVDETIKSKADGRITGVDDTMEYKKQGDANYIAITADTVENLAAGTYLVRYKETENYFASSDKQIVIADGVMLTIAFNSNEGTSVDSVTCEWNQTITAPTEPTKDGFEFISWYLDDTLTTKWTNEYQFTADTTLYAKWVQGTVSDHEDHVDEIEADGLNDVAKAEETDIKLVVQVEEATEGDSEQTAIKGVADAPNNFGFYDITLEKSSGGYVTNASSVIEIKLPYDFTRKTNIKVYRYHSGASEELAQLDARATAPYVDGKCYVDKSNNCIYIYSSKFSTYAVAYDTVRSSSGGGTTRYTVKFDTDDGSSISNATVNKNAKVTEPKAPEKDGYTFGGWYTDEELTEKYDFESKVTKNFTLFAKWDKHDDEQSGTDTHNCPSKAFDDLDITKWYHLDTDYVIENGIFKGTTETTFEPDAAQTRAMMVTVLYRAEGEPVVNRSIPFADVDMGAYYANAVIWGQQNGIVKGVSETEFGPNDKITREQIAAIMHRYAQYKGVDVSVGENTNILSYDDFDSISEYAIPSMQWAVGSGLIKGKSESTLNPLDNATRAEIAAILHRFIEANK